MPKKEYHTGIVMENDTDSDKKGILKIECPTIATGEALECEPIFHYVDSAKQAGSFWIPEVGSQVEVEIECEEDSEVTDLNPRWKCTVYPTGTVPEVFQENYPKRRGWRTPEGHILYFDDTEDELIMTYEHPTGATIVVNDDGDIILTPASGRGVLIGSENASQDMVRGDRLRSHLDGIETFQDTHVHPFTGVGAGNPGTTSPATGGGPTPSSDIFSNEHKVD
jgi:hypothetical protein